MLMLNLLLSVVICSAQVVKVSIGKAYDKKNKLIYTEKHVEKYEDGKLLSLETEYFDLTDKKFATLVSDFSMNPYVPYYEYKDPRFGRRDGIRKSKKKNKVIAFAKSKEGSELKESFFEVEKNTVSGQGLYAYFHANFDELLNMKKAKYVKFLIPMNQDQYSFIIVQIKKTKEIVTYQIKLQNWFLRMFAPDIEVTYRIKDKKLLKFEGPSNVPDQNQKLQSVVIKYVK